MMFLTLLLLSQLSPAADWAAHAANRYQIFPNLTYLTASNHELKLDIYKRRDTTGPQPTIIYMHGGFWAAGTKEGALMTLMPWFEMGWKAVMLHQALAKAGTPNQLLTIPGGRHGGFTPEERTRIYTVVREFLAKNGLGGK